MIKEEIELIKERQELDKFNYNIYTQEYFFIWGVALTLFIGILSAGISLQNKGLIYLSILVYGFLWAGDFLIFIIKTKPIQRGFKVSREVLRKKYGDLGVDLVKLNQEFELVKNLTKELKKR